MMHGLHHSKGINMHLQFLPTRHQRVNTSTLWEALSLFNRENPIAIPAPLFDSVKSRLKQVVR